jgi:hypothetical protein
MATGVIAKPTLEQALRTLGLQLDRLGVPDACFTIAADGITVETENPAAREYYPWNALGEQAAAQKQRRQDTPTPRPELDREALTRWPVLLRLVGTVLDSERVQTGQLGVVPGTAADPTRCRVDWVADGKTRSLREDVLFVLLRRRAQHRATEQVTAAPEPPQPPEPPWWWRRWP